MEWGMNNNEGIKNHNVEHRTVPVQSSGHLVQCPHERDAL